ncbi:hypothetical protein S7711_02638 [Stachybotrys chartarum IBT 7711]|uniref:Gfo/Idh/MocA-like oxidoreductase N-terminal domain-containing protein n=1 Tax=Stachybotrys chartarum (strain CBS 109288 / IBT 7711) TaxID=1280523 RepID=A0A084B920_STACB|nr:hypothetical protein S7711_02638 [Stachybotrys chartarum IBT 7711]
MAPIRVGLVGLSGKQASSTRLPAWSSVAHLPTYLQSSDFELVAVCNGSVESAQRAITAFQLPSTVKAYGNPEDLACDPSVDLVVVSVGVVGHYALAKPALLKNKQVFVEWPLAASTKQADELTQLARDNNLKTIVGVQARGDPINLKIKEIVDSGKIGRVTSTSVLATTAAVPSDTWLEGLESSLDFEVVGANAYHVVFAHFIDTLTHVLGGFDTQTIQSVFKREVDSIPVPKADGSTVQHSKTVPDSIFVQGSLASGALASIAMRWVHLNEAINGVGVRWIISGTEGELELTTDMAQWQFKSEKTLKLKLRGKEVEEVGVKDDGPAFTKGVPGPGVNTALILDAFAKGDTTRYADFEQAPETHRLLDVILEKSGYKH